MKTMIALGLCLGAPRGWANAVARLPEGTIISLRSSSALNTEHAKPDNERPLLGQACLFEVARDVRVGEHLIVRQGTPVNAHVAYSSAPGYVKTPASLTLALDPIPALGGSLISVEPLRVEGSRGSGGVPRGYVLWLGFDGRSRPIMDDPDNKGGHVRIMPGDIHQVRVKGAR
ncbi:MAG: hypothetical protein HY921_09600 [Elusimicrobia bacterium]|nr:hypothetical protein [Elusimicrobiota bacterium]